MKEQNPPPHKYKEIFKTSQECESCAGLDNPWQQDIYLTDGVGQLRVFKNCYFIVVAQPASASAIFLLCLGGVEI